MDFIGLFAVVTFGKSCNDKCTINVRTFYLLQDIPDSKVILF